MTAQDYHTEAVRQLTATIVKCLAATQPKVKLDESNLHGIIAMALAGADRLIVPSGRK